MHNICTFALCSFGSDEVVKRWGQKLINGESMANFSLTEPRSGSDAAQMKTKAVREGGGWRINGRKAWVSLAGGAEV